MNFYRDKIRKIETEGKDTQPPVENTTESINVAASGVHKSWVIQLPDHNKVSDPNEGFLKLETDQATTAP